MSLILNVAVSPNWAFPDCNASSCSACRVCYDCHNPECQCALPEGFKTCEMLPSVMLVDYVRLYQDPERHSQGCDTERFPTAEFIAAHADRYADWRQPSEELETGRQWSADVSVRLAVVVACMTAVIGSFACARWRKSCAAREHVRTEASNERTRLVASLQR
jgi:hypothetical protein